MSKTSQLNLELHLFEVISSVLPIQAVYCVVKPHPSLVSGKKLCPLLDQQQQLRGILLLLRIIRRQRLTNEEQRQEMGGGTSVLNGRQFLPEGVEEQQMSLFLTCRFAQPEIIE